MSLPASEVFKNGSKRPRFDFPAKSDLNLGAASANSASPEAFVPTPAWNGSKPGYYYGTGSQGTGYYIESSNENSTAPGMKKRRGVQIAEDFNETRIIMNAEKLLENAEENARYSKVIDLTVKGVRIAALALSKAIEANEIQRGENPDQPEMYMDSEVALYEAISILKALAADPSKLYPAIVETELINSLIQLLLHDNTDIVTAVVAVLLEWLDVALLQEEDDGSLVAPVAALGSYLLQNGAENLVDNLGRLQGGAEASEEQDEVGKGTEDILTLLENLMEMDLVVQTAGDDESIGIVPSGGSVAATLCNETRLVSWLFQQVEANQLLQGRSLEILALLSPREDAHAVQPNWSKLPPYSSSLVQDSKNASGTKDKTGIDAIEILLQAIAVYRKRQPVNDQQIETLENACMVLASTLTFSSKNVQAFLDRQGVELVIRCLKERSHAGGVALKLLDFTGSDPVHQQACEHLVAAGALKCIFPLFMGRYLPRMALPAATLKRAKREWVESIETTTIRILYALVFKLKDDSPNDAKQRLLAKFVGDDRCDRLVEQCIAYDRKTRMAEYKFFRSDVEEEMKDETAVQLAVLEAKLAGGGDTLHRLSAIAAFCCVGSKRCHERILSQLALQQSGIGVIRDALEEFASALEDSDQKQRLERYLEQI
jgi:beta-catenin-like protein 1